MNTTPPVAVACALLALIAPAAAQAAAATPASNSAQESVYTRSPSGPTVLGEGPVPDGPGPADPGQALEALPASDGGGGGSDGTGTVVSLPFTGLAVRFVRDCGARVIIRGVRSLSDMESEFTMTLANRKLDPEIETVFLMADDEFSHVSSSLIKQITPLAGDEELARFIPREIVPDLRARIGKERV